MDIIKFDRNRKVSKFEVYCGRQKQNIGLGNPFGFKSDSKAIWQSKDLESCLSDYRKWLSKLMKAYFNLEDFENLEPFEKQYAEDVITLATSIKNGFVSGLVCWCVNIPDYKPTKNDVEKCHTQILLKCCYWLINTKKIG